MLNFHILSHNSSKTGYAHLRAKVHFFSFIYFFQKTNEQAKQLRAHGKPWMQRVPYTFPLHKLPPELRFLKRFFSVSFCLSEYSLDKIKVGGDSCLPRHFDYIKVSSPYYRTGDSAGDLFRLRGVTLKV